ncbi:MAG: hypothetical protein KDK91_22060 [Gammaproteobacteria bacterium]|nr:hypothetical protein [Gammaproteobacteria bacterium]
MALRAITDLSTVLQAGHLSRTGWVNFACSAGYLLVLVFLPSSIGLPIAMVASVIAWRLTHRRAHLVLDTPTARIHSAAQGYVELCGVAELMDGATPLQYAGLPGCVWFQVVASEQNYGWLDTPLGRQQSVRVSEDTFWIRDATGVCIIDPDHAEVLACHARRWSVGEHRYMAKYIRPGDPLYVLGELQTVRIDANLDEAEEVRELLREWKRDPASLLQRFDRNADGRLNETEWAEARAAAVDEVERRREQLSRQPALNLIKAPADGRPFLLATEDPQGLGRRYLRWSWLHLFIALATSVYALAGH